MSTERARKIKVILFDVDGVLTDGGIWLFPAPAGAEQQTQKHAEPRADKGGYAIVSRSMLEAKGFHAHDGVGVSLARLAGMKVGVITKRISETVALRARDLRLDYVYQGQNNKVEALEAIVRESGVREDEIAYMGDDIVDLTVMRRVGLAISVPNAREMVKREAHYVTERRGGDGAARDAIEYILQAKGIFEEILERYLETKLAHEVSGN